jgi:hypothetical protein
MLPCIVHSSYVFHQQCMLVNHTWSIFVTHAWGFPYVLGWFLYCLQVIEHIWQLTKLHKILRPHNNYLKYKTIIPKLKLQL